MKIWNTAWTRRAALLLLAVAAIPAVEPGSYCAVSSKAGRIIEAYRKAPNEVGFLGKVALSLGSAERNNSRSRL